VYVVETTERARLDVLAGTLARDWREYYVWIVGDPDAVAEKLDREAWVRSMTLLKERVLRRGTP